MSKYTAGPWEYHAKDNVITAPGVHRLIDIIPRSIEVSSEEREANGKLIAAAPELLGALRFILAFYEPGQNYLDGNAWKQAEANARYAMAKAEGREV